MPPVPDEISNLYCRALLLARDRGYRLNREGVQRVYRAFAEILNRLAAEEGTEVLTPERAERFRQELDAMLRQLNQALTKTTEASVGGTLVDLTEIHRQATSELFKRFGTRGVALARGFDSVPARALATMVSRPNAETFQTLYRRHIQSLAPEIDTFLDAAVARGVSAGRGAKDLARLMAKDDPRLIRLLDRADVLTGDLHRGAGAIDYAAYGLDEADTKALRGLLYNSRRIQVTETNNALRAANDAAVDESPVVLATQWQRSGRHHRPDLCDVFAETDAYGLGPGFYPAGKFPIAAHSHCGCYPGQALFRSPADWGKPKPPAPPIEIDPTDPRHTEAWSGQWTDLERDRNQAQFAAIMGESGARRTPVPPVKSRRRVPRQPRPSASPPAPPQPIPPTRSLTRAQIDGLANMQAHLPGRPPDWEVLKQRQRIAIDDDQFVRRLAPVPDDWRIEVRSFQVNGETANIRLQFLDPSNRFAGFLYRTFDFGPRRNVHHDYFQLAPIYRGGGIGSQVLREQVALYKELGMKTVDMLANLDVGGYAWARYGFVPNANGWAALRRLARSRLPDGDLKNRILASRDPKDIRVLAATPEGKAMLLGSSWNGLLDLEDAESMAFFDAYVNR